MTHSKLASPSEDQHPCCSETDQQNPGLPQEQPIKEKGSRINNKSTKLETATEKPTTVPMMQKTGVSVTGFLVARLLTYLLPYSTYFTYLIYLLNLLYFAYLLHLLYLFHLLYLLNPLYLPYLLA
jgi:hypothetical protein